MTSNNLDKDSAKLLVLGDSGVGKSSLIHLICHSAILSSAQWTIGCSIDVKLHDDVFLEFWDIGGSRSHKIARSFLYQGYHGIILVFDAKNNKSRLNLDEWRKEATQKSNDKDLETYVSVNNPIITIATKKDLLPYGSVLEFNKNSTVYNDQHCSVVNFNESLQPNFSYQRRQQSSSNSSTSPLYSSTNALSLSHSHSSYSNVPLLDNQVIYVNTQDVSSFSPGSKEYLRLNNFFKQVIDRRNRIYNKFAI